MKFERNVESIVFAYETDAIDTLVHLKDIIKAYGRVTVKDLMDLVGVAPNPDDDRCRCRWRHSVEISWEKRLISLFRKCGIIVLSH